MLFAAELIPLMQQLFRPTLDQRRPHFGYALVKLLQLHAMILFILKGLLNHFQFIQIFNNLGLFCLSLLILQPQTFEILLILLAQFFEYLDDSFVFLLKLLLLAACNRSYVTLQYGV